MRKQKTAKLTSKRIIRQVELDERAQPPELPGYATWRKRWGDKTTSENVGQHQGGKTNATVFSGLDFSSPRQFFLTR